MPAAEIETPLDLAGEEARRRFAPFMIGVVGIHILFLFLALTKGHHYLTDSYEYLRQAENLRTQGISYAGDLANPINPALLTRRPPGYPAMIAAVRLLWASDTAIVIFQTGLSILTWALLYRILAAYGLAQRSAILLAGLILFPSQLIYTQLVMAEVLFQTLLVASFYFLALYFRRPTTRLLFLYNLLLGLTVFVKPVMAYFWVGNLAWLLAVVKTQHAGVRLTLGCIPALMVLLLSTWNMARTSYFHVSSIQADLLVRYNVYHLVLAERGQDAADAEVAAILGAGSKIGDLRARLTYLSAEAERIIRAHPRRYAAFHLKGMVNFFLDPGRFDLYTFLGLQEPSQRGLLFQFAGLGYRGIWRYLGQMPRSHLACLGIVFTWNAITLVAFVAFLLHADGRIPRPVRVVSGLLVFYLALITGPVGASRFKVAAYPVLLLGAISFVDRRLALRTSPSAMC